MSYKYYNYDKTPTSTTSRFPVNTHLIFEIDYDNNPGRLIIVDSVDSTKVYYSGDYGVTWTQMDVDPSNTSGDNKSRDHSIQSAWHDKTNEIIYFLDCDNDGTGDNFDVWKLDYSTWESFSITEIGTSVGADANSVYAWDIFKIGVNVYVINQENRVTTYYVIREVSSAPFTEIIVDNTTRVNVPDSWFGLVIGSNFYIPVAKPTGGTDDAYMLIFDSITPALSMNIDDEADNVERPSNHNLHGTSYDGSDIIYCIFYSEPLEHNVLGFYSISDDDWTVRTIKHDIALMLDRNTDSTANPPNNLEKGFHLTLMRIYQIPLHYTGRLNWISVGPPGATGTIKAITDHFLIDNSGNVYEYVNLISSILMGWIYHERQNYPYLEMKFNSDNITILTQMFIQIIGYYLANDSNNLYFGTYNFKDEADGTSGTDIAFITAVSNQDADTTITIVASLDGHRKLLKITDANGAGYLTADHTIGSTEANATFEFFIAVSNITSSQGAKIVFYEGATEICGLYVDADDLFTANPGVTYIKEGFILIDILFHIKIVLDDTANTFDCYINGILEGNNVAYRNNSTAGINKIVVGSGFDDVINVYYDAIGFSWDTNYNIGDNLLIEEGEPNQVVFEGIAKRPTKGRFQYVHVDNQASEMDQIKPRGTKAGRSDQIISDINDDGAPYGPEYIVDGTLAEGSAMGTLDLSGAKDYRTVVNDLAEHDGFLWYIRTQGALDYNAGGVDSGADLRYDGSGNLDTILQLQAWTIAKLNQIIVNGAINPITGIPYSGKWDDEDDQQQNGINPITIEDAQLNSDTKCQAKADEMGANEVERTRARFKFRKISYGFIQPGQTITFKYDVTNYITISEAQYILDKLTMNIKTEIGFAELSSGL